MDFMEASSGTNFDPEVLNALKRVVALYPAGCCVELAQGVRCIVVENYSEAPARPKLKRLDGDPKSPEYIDLYADRQYANVNVAEIIDVD